MRTSGSAWARDIRTMSVRSWICGAGSNRLLVRSGAERRPPVARGPPGQAGAPAESSCREIALFIPQTPPVTKRDAQRPPFGARVPPAPSIGACVPQPPRSSSEVLCPRPRLRAPEHGGFAGLDLAALTLISRLSLESRLNL